MEDYTNQSRRWYDQDPVLSKAMSILETSDDKLQIQVAINLIKVIIEHNVENNIYTTIDDLIAAVTESDSERRNARWYDIDRTLKTAIQMLETCPQSMYSKIAHNIADLISKELD